MRVLLFLASATAFALGVLLMAAAKGAIHEIQGSIFFLIAAVLFSAAAIVDAIVSLERRLKANQGAA